MDSPLQDVVSYDKCESCSRSLYDDECEHRCALSEGPPCAECAEGGKSDECLECCSVQEITEMNYVAMDDNTGWLEDHWAALRRWRERIDQKPNGAFVKYDKILRKHFGLEATFSTTRIATSETRIWPRHSNHRWHDPEDRQTTICYLTMPGHRSVEKEYSLSIFEAEGGSFSISTAQEMSILLPKAGDASTLRPRFKRALKILGLKPHLHPSQELSVLSPTTGHEQGPDRAKDADASSANVGKNGMHFAHATETEVTLTVSSRFSE